MQVLTKHELKIIRKEFCLHVDSDDQVILGLSLDIIQSLVADIHENGWKVGHHEDTRGNHSYSYFWDGSPSKLIHRLRKVLLTLGIYLSINYERN